MARAALRPRVVLRARNAFRPRAARPGKSAPAEPAVRPAEETGAKATKGRWTRRGREEDPRPAGRRPLPFPLRLLAMLLAFAFMVGFAVVLARVTLEPSPASEALVHSNLRPGRSLQAYLDQPELREAVRQIGGNLLLGVPFGVLVPVLAPRARGLLRVLLLTASVMLLVEFAQGALVTGRAFDIDDVILNTTGALIGYLLVGRRMSRAVHARERHA
ncbi:VanZ family protein [Streptomyces sp. NPDC051315]|uniref:VanZ family protein n=1 Tax=Streptomyces sp. NPDC051315 TaxID=3365650 RepID=UPI00379C8F44